MFGLFVAKCILGLHLASSVTKDSTSQCRRTPDGSLWRSSLVEQPPNVDTSNVLEHLEKLVNAFVTTQDVIPITFFIGQDSKGHLFAAGDDKTLREGMGVVGKVEEHKAVLAYPSFKTNSQIFDASLASTDGKMEVKLSAVRFNLLKFLLKTWTLTNEGEPVPVNEETISSLHPNIGSYLASQVEQLVSLL